MYGVAAIGTLAIGDFISTASSLASDAQSFAPGDIVTLYDIDTTPIGGTDIWYFCSGLIDGVAPQWKGNTYVPFPIEASGFEWTGRGALPRPKITVANAGTNLLSSVIQYHDLLGVKVTRWKTLAKYLDGQPNADPEAYFVPDIYFVDRKSGHTKTMIEFELAASLDQQGVMLPSRQVIRDSCTWTYRQYVNGEFVYGSCPYAGTTYLTVAGYATTESGDVCPKSVVGCKARFGDDADLPYGGFPSVSRVR